MSKRGGFPGGMGGFGGMNINSLMKEAKKMHNEELKTQLEKISSFIALYLKSNSNLKDTLLPVSYTHLRAHET